MLSDPVLVVGDSMLDRYWDGAVDRISPEAPVPVLRMGGEWQRAGGAANVAMNLAALQCRATLGTVVGEDEAGARLCELLQRAGVEMMAVRSPDHPTTQKIRAVCRRQQLLRVDIEQPAPPALARALADLVIDLLPSFPWVVLSDYAKGALQDSAGLIRRGMRQGARVLVDPKGEDFTRYQGAWLLEPNAAEIRRVVGIEADDPDFDHRLHALRQRLGLAHLLVTLGERGLVLYSPDRMPLRVPAQRREVFDVSGAGDTLLAALAGALAHGLTLDDAVHEAQHAAGIVVGKFGTSVVTPAELGRDLELRESGP